MDITPVRKYKTPKYPTKEDVIKNPEILKTIPQRWRGNLFVGAAFSTLLLFTLTSCEKKETGSSSTGTESYGVAPIFEHGEGRGSFGCVSVAPPSFLSEEEAFQVIQEELASYDITLERNGLTLENVNVPETKFYFQNTSIDSTVKRNLELDGYDAEKKIAFEYISHKDYVNWLGKEAGMSTVNTYDFLTTAKMLQSELEKDNTDISVGIFYDPMSRLSEEVREEIINTQDWNSLSKRAWEMSKEDLRMQVRDFIEWLKAAGII